MLLAALLADAGPHAQGGSSLAVMVSPDEGPSGTQATITVSGAQPGDPITLTIGRGLTTGIADANGNATFTHTFFGRPDEVIPISAQAGPSADSPTASTQFTIKAAGPTGVDVAAGGGAVDYSGPTVSIDTALGSNLDNVERIWTFDAATQQWQLVWPLSPLPPNLSTQPPPEFVDGQLYWFVTTAGFRWLFPVAAGDGNAAALTVTVSPDSGPTGTTATFTITEPPPFGVSVSPDSGPNGTMATITVVGAEPGATITLDIVTGDTLMAVANAAGTATFNYQFFGEIDEVLTMTATQADPAATAMTAFTVTG